MWWCVVDDDGGFVIMMFVLNVCGVLWVQVVLVVVLVFVGCLFVLCYECLVVLVLVIYVLVDVGMVLVVELFVVQDVVLFDDWYVYFIDLVLQVWIDVVFVNNCDLWIVVGWFDEVCVLYGVQCVDWMLLVDVNFGYECVCQYDLVVCESVISGLYCVGVGISVYEFDLFGCVCNLFDVVFVEYFVMVDVQCMVCIGVIVEVVGVYVFE